jgi:hypothetical protein
MEFPLFIVDVRKMERNSNFVRWCSLSRTQLSRQDCLSIQTKIAAHPHMQAEPLIDPICSHAIAHLFPCKRFKDAFTTVAHSDVRTAVRDLPDDDLILK